MACAKDRLVPAAESELTAAVESALGFTMELGSAITMENEKLVLVVRVVVSVTTPNPLQLLAW